MDKIIKSLVELGKVWEHHCATIEDLMLKVQDECEVRGLSASQTIEVCSQVRTFAISAQDYRAGIRDCKGAIYDKWYRYNRTDDGTAYDKGWMFQNKSSKCDKVTFLNA